MIGKSPKCNHTKNLVHILKCSLWICNTDRSSDLVNSSQSPIPSIFDILLTYGFSSECNLVIYRLVVLRLECPSRPAISERDAPASFIVIFLPLSIPRDTYCPYSGCNEHN